MTEPHLPSVCVRLRAAITADVGTLRDADEERLDTVRLQQALDHCTPGQAVELAAAEGHDAFLTGPLRIPRDTSLVVDKGVTLFGSRDPAVYETRPGSCGVVGQTHEPGCRPLISIMDAPNTAVMGDGVIDGRGYAKLLHGTVSWWDLAEQARQGGAQKVPRLLVADRSDNVTLYRITLKNSPNFHVVFGHAKGFTAWSVRIDTPKKARNTDGIDPVSASDITITQSFLSTGDDHVAIKGSGTGVQYVSVTNNHFYFGHGMSIGSETFAGVSDVLVQGLTIDGADNGLRIKSNVHRGGLVQRVQYRDVCIRDTRFPITLDTRYDNGGPQSDLIPEFRGIRFEDVRISGGGKLVVDGDDAQHRTQVQFSNVELDDPARYTFFAKDAVVTYGPGQVNFSLQGNDVVTSKVAAPVLANSTGPKPCAERFVAFPR